MKRRKKQLLLWMLIPLLLMGVLGFLYVHSYINPDFYKRILQDSLTTAIGREVLIGKATLTLWGGVGIAFEDFQIRDRSQKFDLFRSQRVILKLKLLPLIGKEVQWKRIVLERPVLRLFRDKRGQFNLSDEPLEAADWKTTRQKLIQTLATLFGGALTLRDGLISVSDDSVDSSPRITEIREFNLQFSKVAYHQSFPFRLSGEIHHVRNKGLFSITGTLRDMPDDMDLSKGKAEVDVEIMGMDVDHFWPYLKPFLPMETIAGVLDVRAHYQGDFAGAFKGSAKIRLKDVLFDYPKVFSYVLEPKWLNIDLEMAYDQKDITLPRVSVEMPELSVRAKGKIYAIGEKGMGIDAEAQSDPFDLSDGRKFIPYRVITPDVSERLFQAEGSGPVQLVSVKLSGTMDEINHCDLPSNAHVLSVEMRVDGARLKFPWDLPPLEDLRGNLLFKECHLHLKGLEGRLFHSRIDRANGMIYQLLLAPALQLSGEGRMEMTDLPSLAAIEGISEDLSFLSIQSGRADYRVSVSGTLTPPLRLQHEGTYRLSRTRFTHRQLPFPVFIGEGRVDFSNDGFEWSGTKVEFGNTSLKVNGSWKTEGKSKPFELSATGRVDFKNLFSLSKSSLSTEGIRSMMGGIESLSGTGDLTFKGRTSKGRDLFSYEGEVISKGVSLHFTKVPSPLHFKEGTVSFSNRGIRFSKAKVLHAHSSLSLDGSIQEGNMNLSTQGFLDLKSLASLLQSPFFSDGVRSRMGEIQAMSGTADLRLKWVGETEAWATSLQEGKVRFQGVSFQHRALPFPLSQIDGEILLSPEQVQVDGLKGNLGNSPIALTALLSRDPYAHPSSRPPEKKAGGPSPRKTKTFTLQVHSPQLDLDLLLPKTDKPTPPSLGALRDWISNWSFHGRITVDQGKLRGLDFEHLKVTAKTVDNRLVVLPFQLKANGGEFWGEGWMQPSDGGVRFEINPRLSKMEAKAFLRTLFQKGKEEEVQITGKVYVDQMELRGEGNDFQKIKESLNGKLRLEFEEGVIERFNLLAKIFSILNVTQVLRGRVPDFTTKGLPYHRILGHIQIKDGIASTEDFVVDSDAMRITLFGKVDLGKNLIDAKVGVHPLVTIDSVLSNVPVAGYILTGKNKAFLSYIYEVKGDLGDPKIEAIPVKSLGEGVFGILKRLVETPLRPFQKAPSPDKNKN